MQDKLSKCYIWHIITLAKMKSNLRTIRRKKKWIEKNQTMMNCIQE